MSVTNARRVKDVVEQFRCEAQLPTLCADPPVVYTEDQITSLRGFRQYSKGSLAAIAEAVEDRAAAVLEAAMAQAGGTAMVNDRVVDQLQLYAYDPRVVDAAGSA